MSAGERCCAVGVIRFVIGDVFNERTVTLEAHHGIEDADVNVEYTRLEEHPLGWEKAKALVPAKDFQAVMRFVAACEKELMTDCAAAKGKRLEKFDEGKVRKPAVPFSPL